MKKRALSLTVCVILLVTLFSACKKTDVKAFYFAVESPAGTFDPTIASDTTARMIVRNCFEGLVYADENGGITPGVALSWDISPDGLTYTFKLRADACWHLTSNAQEELAGKLPENFDLSVTAADFAFALKRAVDPAMGARDAYLLENVAGASAIMSGNASPDTLGVQAVSDHELKITLARPQSDFLHVLTEPLCMPCSETFFNATGGRYGLYIKDSLSNGPFYLSYFDDTSYRISKNPDYHGEHTPKADVIRLNVYTDKNTLYSKLKSNNYSGAYLTQSDLAVYAPDKKATLVSTADKTRSFILNAGSPALSDAGIRNAFILATDVEGFVSLCGGRSAVLSPVPEAVKGFAAFSGGNAYDPEKAVSVLNSSLEKSGLRSVTVTLKCEESFELTLKKQLQNWQKIFGTSFNINVTPLSADELRKAVETGDYDIAFYPVGSKGSSPNGFFRQFLSYSPDNVFGVKSEELDNAVKAAGTTEAAAALTRSLAANAVILPVWSESSCFVCTEKVGGVKLLPGKDNIFFYDCDTK